MPPKLRPNKSGLQAWWQLVRPPNLFTVPGDPLAGYLVANAGILDWSLVAVMLSSLFLYAAGLVMNDLADLEEDRRHRPERPLPSGAVSARGAWLLTGALSVAGLTVGALTGRVAPFGAALGLLALITLYNFGTKRLPVVGALNMGACRALSVMLGALAGPLALPQLSGIVAAIIGLYIAAVTNLARHETAETMPKWPRLLPAPMYVAGCAAGIGYALRSPARQWAIALFALGSAAVIFLAVQLWKKPEPLPPLIGAHIRLLLVLQGAICYVADPWVLGPPLALLFLATWPLSWWTAQRFYAS